MNPHEIRAAASEVARALRPQIETAASRLASEFLRRAHDLAPEGGLLTTSRALITAFVCKLAEAGVPEAEAIRQGRMAALEGELEELGAELAAIGQDDWWRDDQATHDLLLIADDYEVPLEAIQGWSDDQCREADNWAVAEHLAANDNDVERLPVPPLVDSERLALGEELVRLEVAKNDLAEKRREAMADFNARAKALDNQAAEIVGVLREGAKRVPVEVRTEFDYATGIVTTFRLDTGAVLEERPMTDAEGQMALGGEDEEVPS